MKMQIETVIDLMELSFRSQRILHRLGVKTAIDLASLTERGIRSAKQCGKLTCAEILKERDRVLRDPLVFAAMVEHGVAGPRITTQAKPEGEAIQLPATYPSVLSRIAASKYLDERHCLSVAPATLARKACVGGGPAFYKAANSVLYKVEELDRWAAEQYGDPRS